MRTVESIGMKIFSQCLGSRSRPRKWIRKSGFGIQVLTQVGNKPHKKEERRKLNVLKRWMFSLES
jgi:hypothetical protein